MFSVIRAMVGYENDVSNAIVDDNIIHDDSESDFSLQYYCVVDVVYEDYDIFYLLSTMNIKLLFVN